MFTGIVTDIGKIQKIEKRGDVRARIETSYDTATIDIGASIACNGVCLTVIDCGIIDKTHWFDVDISAETISKTNISSGRLAWHEGRPINLERALKLGDEMGGHIVSGHVDGIAEITDISPDGDSIRVSFNAPDSLAGFIAPKGSVALNGTSLTVNGVNGTAFDVNFIPHTQTVTTWGDIQVGDSINLEIDTLARYVARLNEYKGA